MTEPNPREQQLFDSALELPPAERTAFVAAATEDDPALRERVLALLHEHATLAEDFLAPPEQVLAQAAAAVEALPPGPPCGERIGRYLLREEIGQGGCGIVYRAEQLAPVRREVALKVIKLGMDTRDVIARFAAEQQALALMDHPNIARVFDAGATEGGRPYFVMELVRGPRITDYCDRARLPVRARLQLFIAVCGAVEHAHQKGIIHRDLKPSNILVADGVPKVIDFGIAKATQGPLADRTVFTALDQFVGTPAYMSPEQAERPAADIDTRSDVYSLGVLLYELLTGCTPIEAAELKQAAMDEMRRRIRNFEAPPPSARMRTLEHATLSATAAQRQVEPETLIHLLRGDLDWIAMRCLEKDRNRRYETVSALSRDLERHLAHEPVTARPPTLGYVLAKLVRRHRVAFAASGAVALLLALATGVATFLYLRATAAERQQARLRQQAELEVARSNQVVQFVGNMLQGVEPAVARGRDPAILKELLDDTVARLDAARGLQPEVEADLRVVIGGIYLHLRQPVLAERMQRRALALRLGAFGPQHPKVAESLLMVGDALEEQRRVAAATPYWASALALQQKLFGAEARETLGARLRLAGAAWAKPDYPAAHARFSELQRLQQRCLAPDDPLMARTLLEHARVFGSEADYAAAIGMLRECLARYRLPETAAQRTQPVFDPQVEYAHPPTQDEVWQQLSEWLSNDHRYPEAEAAARRALELERKSALVNPDTLVLLANALRAQNRHADATEALQEAVGMFHAGFAKDSSWLYRRSLADSLCLLGECLYRTGRYAEAATALREALPHHRRHGGLQARSIDPGYLLGAVLVQLGRTDEAEAVYRDALGWAPARWTNPFAYDAYVGFDRLLRERRTPAERAGWWREQAAMAQRLRETNGDQRAPVVKAGMTMIEQVSEGDLPNELRALRFSFLQLRAMLACGQGSLAEEVARAHLDWRNRRETHVWSRAAMQGFVGLALAAQQDFHGAEPLLIAAHDALRSPGVALPPGTRGLPQTFADALANGYARLGQISDTTAWKAKAAEDRTAAR